ncbi:MAG: protein NinG [Robiginitomaculum sp.]|nr:MAG: protein NinG [Robiginitomaculum sp.]
MKCKICKDKFEPKYFLQKACFDPKCLAEYAKLEREKKSDKKAVIRKREFKDNDKTLRAKVAQQVFNTFIRARDKDVGCVSCDKTKDWTGQWHAGHFYTTKARPDVRFNEDNCHKQCSICNNHLSGNIGEYRPVIIERIGQERFLALSLNKVRRYTCAELKEIELCYRLKLKELIALT